MLERESPIKVICFALWFLGLVPWAGIMLLIGMAFDHGNTLEAWVVVVSALSYPITVAVAWRMRDQRPFLVALPLVSIGGAFLSRLFHNVRF